MKTIEIPNLKTSNDELRNSINYHSLQPFISNKTIEINKTILTIPKRSQVPTLSTFTVCWNKFVMIY